MPFENHHVAFAEALGRQLAGGHASEREEQTVCTLAALSLRHAYPAAVVAVSPAPGRLAGALGLGTLDVRLSWPFSAEPALLVRVVVHDELVRGAVARGLRGHRRRGSRGARRPRRALTQPQTRGTSMKITIESTGAIVHANGLPTRLWEGKTERGTPVIALITRLGVPDGTDASELERDLGPEQPTRFVIEGQEPVITGRSCTVCLSRDKRRPATHVARDAGGLEWFECGAHDPTDNVAETIRVALEPIGAWFDRHAVPPGALEPSPAVNHQLTAKPSAPSWLVKDFWVLYQAAKALADACSGRGDGRPYLPLRALEAQLDRLRAAFEVCEAERRGEAVPDAAVPNAAELVARARGRVMRADVFALRSIVGGWREHDEVTLVGPALLASGLLTALDALAIVHGPEAEAEAAELDKFMAQTAGGYARPAPRALTDGERTALAALHRWLHSPSGDCELIEAAQSFHDQVESESPAECRRLEAEEKAWREAEAKARASADSANETARALFDRVGLALGIGMPTAPTGHEECSPDAAPHSPLAAKIIRAIVLDERAVDAATDDPSKLFMAHALRGAQMGWHARVKHPGEVDRVAELGAPKDEPARSAWLFGFGVAVRTPDPATEPTPPAPSVVVGGVCRGCGCTNEDCSACIAKTGGPCHWVEPDLCSACAPAPAPFPDTRPKDASGEPTRGSSARVTPRTIRASTARARSCSCAARARRRRCG